MASLWWRLEEQTDRCESVWSSSDLIQFTSLLYTALPLSLRNDRDEIYIYFFTYFRSNFLKISWRDLQQLYQFREIMLTEIFRTEGFFMLFCGFSVLWQTAFYCLTSRKKENARLLRERSFIAAIMEATTGTNSFHKHYMQLKTDKKTPWCRLLSCTSWQEVDYS